MTGALLVVGELCVDIIVRLDGDLRFGQHEQLVPGTVMVMGSSSAITACAAARLGVPTSLVSVRGDDVFGAFLREELRRRGVTEAGRVDETLPTGSSVHLTRPNGDRAILTAMGSVGTTLAADVTAGLLAEHRHLHVGSYFLQRGLWPDVRSLFVRAHAAGLSTSLDGNFDPEESWDRGISEALPEVDVLFGNERELTGIAGVQNPGEAVERLLDRMPSGAVVVLKQGADGAVAALRGAGCTLRWEARSPAVDGPLVDTVGAGDTLAAGFLAARLTGAEVPYALAHGVACGTASTRGAGGVAAQPDRATAAALAARVKVRALER